MSLDVGYGSPVQPHAAAGHGVDDEQKIRIGMLLYILNDVILAIFFFGTYLFLRGYNQNQLFYLPIPNAEPDYTITAWIMIMVAVAGILFVAARLVAGRSTALIFKALLVLAMIAALIDIILQITYMGKLPFTVSDGAFASSFILLSGYHVYHVLVGLFVGAGATVRGIQGRYHRPKFAGLDVITAYWVWMAVYGVAFWGLVVAFPPYR